MKSPAQAPRRGVGEMAGIRGPYGAQAFGGRRRQITGGLKGGEPGAAVRDDPAADYGMRGTHHVAQEVNAVGQRAQPLVVLELEAQFGAQKFRDLLPPCLQLGAITVDQHDVVDVAQVARRAEHVLDELVERVRVDVGEKLARQVADGYAAARRRVFQALMRGNGVALGTRGRPAHAGTRYRIVE